MNEHARISARSRLTSKGQTTVPKEVRDALQLPDGAQIEWVVEKDGSVATVRPRTLRAVDLAGLLGKPPNGRHATIKDMDDAIGEAVGDRFARATRR
jgi:antitoxin PrlF